MCILVAILPKNSFSSENEDSSGVTATENKTNKTKFKRTLQKNADGKKYKAAFTDSIALGSYGHSRTFDSRSWKCSSSGVDLEDVLRVYSTFTPNYCQGAFAFVAVHPVVGLIVARDVMGIEPLYIGINGDETWFASELKALSHCSWYNTFPLGSVYNGSFFTTIEHFVPRYENDLFKVLRNSVEECLCVDVPWGVLLSGGLNSSIIGSLTRFCDRPKGYPVLHTFSIGLENSIDLIACKYVAKEIRSVHHEVTFTVEEGLNTMVEAVYVAETSDLNTLSKCIPLLLLAKHVAASGVKTVLSGLGAKEIFSEENLFTGSIINKCMRSQGIQCTVPFLTSSVMDMASAGVDKERMKNFLKDCVPKYTMHTIPNAIWVEACNQYGENKIRLIYNTLYPGR